MHCSHQFSVPSHYCPFLHGTKHIGYIRLHAFQKEIQERDPTRITHTLSYSSFHLCTKKARNCKQKKKYIKLSWRYLSSGM